MVRQRKRVLVADQSATNRNKLTQLIRQLDVTADLTEVSTLEDCLSKFKKAQKQPFDLALIGNFEDVDQTTLPLKLYDIGEETVIALIVDAPNPDLFDNATTSSVYDCLIAPVDLPSLDRVMKRASLSRDPLPALIVDDTRVMRKVVMKVLGESQFALAISEADSSEMAVSLCRKIPYYCVFLDLNMPVQNGLDTAKQILRLQPQCRIVLMSTSNVDMDDKVAENGLACFLPKPFYPKDINRLLHEFLGLEQPNLSNPDFVACSGQPSSPKGPGKDEHEYILV